MYNRSYVSRQIAYAIVSMQEIEIIVLDPRATKPPSPPFTHAKQYPLSSAVFSQGPPLNPHQRKTSPPTSTFRQSFHKSASIPRNTDTLFPSLFSLSNSRLHGSRSTTNQLPSRRELFLEKVGKGARSSHLRKRDGRGGGSEGVGKSSSPLPREQRNNETPCQESARFIDKREGGREARRGKI